MHSAPFFYLCINWIADVHDTHKTENIFIYLECILCPRQQSRSIQQFNYFSGTIRWHFAENDDLDDSTIATHWIVKIGTFSSIQSLPEYRGTGMNAKKLQWNRMGMGV